MWQSALAASATLLVLDVLWVTQVARPHFRALISEVQGGRPMELRIWYAAAAYGLMLLGLNVFVVPHAVDGWRPALVHGAAFGMVLYGVYDATSGAVLRDWTLRVAAMDVLWGTFVYTAAALAAWATA